MGAARHTFALCALGLIATIGTGCGTSSPLTGGAPDPRTLPAALDRKTPAWLTSGAMPLDAKTPLATESAPRTTVKYPDPKLDLGSVEQLGVRLPAQSAPVSVVPHVEEVREPANNPVGELAPAVLPVIVPVSSEPQWRPAGEGHSP
jgi:hypothetical protein